MMNESKETKEEVTLGELKIWLAGKFETIGARFETVNERFKSMDKRFGMFMWAIGILAGVFVAFSAGTFYRMDRLEALILKNRDEIALNRTAIALNGKAIEVNKALIEEAKCECEPKTLK